jgi:hypothetical protein
MMNRFTCALSLSGLMLMMTGCSNPLVDLTIQGELTDSDELYPEDNSYFDVHTFYTRAGYTITIAQMSTEFDSYTWLISPTGESLMQVDDAGADGPATSRDSLIVFEAPQTGTYSVRANSFEGGETGAYTIRIVTTPPGETLPTIELNQLPDGDQLIRLEEGDQPPEGVVPEGTPPVVPEAGTEGSGAPEAGAEDAAEGSVAAP